MNAKILFILILFSFSAFSKTNCATGRVCLEFAKKALELPEQYTLATRFSLKGEDIRFTKYEGDVIYSSPISEFSLLPIASCGKLCDATFEGSTTYNKLKTYTDGKVFATSWKLTSFKENTWIGVIYTEEVAITVFLDKELWQKWLKELELEEKD